MKRTVVLSIVLVFVLSLSFLWWKNGASAANPSDKKQYTFVVSKGEGVRSIGNRLKRENLIKDPTVFFLVVKKFPLVGLGLDNKIQHGDHIISPSMTVQEVAKSLTLATNDTWVTIQEGLRGDEIADILKKELKTYKESWRKVLDDKEGYLFPDTYLIPKDANINQVLEIFRNNFDAKYKAVENLDKTKLTKSEIVIIASLIEREAKHAGDRPLVSSVIQNRLGLGMKLDIDATVQYALGYQKDEKIWWKKALTFEDLEINSSYNTYKNPGLPPTPISNPGLKSLEAAVVPENTDFLYYFTDKNGVNHYAETLGEHNSNLKKYPTE